MLEELARCTLCPRECGVNRLAGEPGACGAVGETVRSPGPLSTTGRSPASPARRAPERCFSPTVP